MLVGVLEANDPTWTGGLSKLSRFSMQNARYFSFVVVIPFFGLQCSAWFAVFLATVISPSEIVFGYTYSSKKGLSLCCCQQDCAVSRTRGQGYRVRDGRSEQRGAGQGGTIPYAVGNDIFWNDFAFFPSDNGIVQGARASRNLAAHLLVCLWGGRTQSHTSSSISWK